MRRTFEIRRETSEQPDGQERWDRFQPNAKPQVRAMMLPWPVMYRGAS
jgi:hypothetical protein